MLGISIYVIEISLILIFGWVFRADQKRFLTAAFIVLFVVMAFRNAKTIGYDSTAGYYMQFHGIKESFRLGWFDNSGLPFAMRIVRIFTKDYQWFIIITAAWICFAYYRLLVRHSEDGFISVMWFMGMLFYSFLFSALKQAWAMAFLCFAFSAIRDKKLIRFLVLVLFAALFHFPSLVFLPAYWIAKLKINRAFPLLISGAIVFVFIFRTQILNIMLSAYSKGEGNYSEGTRFIGTKFIFMLLIMGYGLYLFFRKNDSNFDSDLFSTLMYFLGIAAIFQTFCFYNNIFERLADYYFQFSVLFMPLIVTSDSTRLALETSENAKIKNRKSSFYAGGVKIHQIDVGTILYVVITVFCVWRFTFYMVNNGYLSPFVFFWQ